MKKTILALCLLVSGSSSAASSTDTFTVVTNNLSQTWTGTVLDLNVDQDINYITFLSYKGTVRAEHHNFTGPDRINWIWNVNEAGAVNGQTGYTGFCAVSSSVDKRGSQHVVLECSSFQEQINGN